MGSAWSAMRSERMVAVAATTEPAEAGEADVVLVHCKAYPHHRRGRGGADAVRRRHGGDQLPERARQRGDHRRGHWHRACPRRHHRPGCEHSRAGCGALLRRPALADRRARRRGLGPRRAYRRGADRGRSADHRQRRDSPRHLEEATDQRGAGRALGACRSEHRGADRCCPSSRRTRSPRSTRPPPSPAPPASS